MRRPRADMVITTYALARREPRISARWRGTVWRMDEAQKIKNPSAASTQAIRSIPAGLSRGADRHADRESPLRTVVDHGDPEPGVAGSGTGSSGNSSRCRWSGWAMPTAAQHLREMIKPFVLRRTKSDPLIAGDLPEKLEMKVYCNLTRRAGGALPADHR